MKTLIILLVLSMATVCYAGQKYNPYSQRWETTPIDSEMKYNPYDQEWSYEDKDSEVEYNPYEQTWDWNEPED